MPVFRTSRIAKTAKTNITKKLSSFETLNFLLFRKILLHPGPLCYSCQDINEVLDTYAINKFSENSLQNFLADFTTLLLVYFESKYVKNKRSREPFFLFFLSFCSESGQLSICWEF